MRMLCEVIKYAFIVFDVIKILKSLHLNFRAGEGRLDALRSLNY